MCGCVWLCVVCAERVPVLLGGVVLCLSVAVCGAAVMLLGAVMILYRTGGFSFCDVSETSAPVWGSRFYAVIVWLFEEWSL